MSHPTLPLSAGYGKDDDLTDVFHGLSLKDPSGIGYCSTSSMMSSMGVAARHNTSAPKQLGGPMMNWPSSISEEQPFVPQIGGGAASSKLIGMWSSNSAQPPTSAQSSQGGGAPGSILSPTFGSCLESEFGSYQDSYISNNGFSPIYFPVTTNGILDSMYNNGSRNGGLSFHSSSITSSAGVHNNIMVRVAHMYVYGTCIHTLVHVGKHVCTCT